MTSSRRLRLATLAALAAASALILWCAPAQYLGRQQDDLLYIVSSRALSQGGYRLFTSPGAPPLTMITPGFPLILLPATWLGGENLGWHQAFCAAVLAACPWALWLWLRRRQDPLDALLICLIWASSPIVLGQAGTVMSEGPYLLATVAFLGALEARASGRAGWILLLLTQLRPAGLSLLPSAVARPIAGQRWASAARTLLPPAAGALAWCLWSWWVSGGVQEAHEFVVSYRGGPLAQPLAVAFDNARFYLSAWGGSYLPESWGGAPALAAGTGLCLAALRGCGGLLSRDRFEPVVWMLAGAAAMHAVWAWQYGRYLIPLLPWLLWTAGLGLGRWARPVLGVLLASQVVFQSGGWLAASRWARPELEQTYAWLKDHTSPSDILASPLYVRDGFYAGRPSLPLPDSADPGSFAAALEKGRARYVLWQERLDLGLSIEKTAELGRLLARAGGHLKEPSLFRLVYENPHENSRVYALR